MSNLPYTIISEILAYNNNQNAATFSNHLEYCKNCKTITKAQAHPKKIPCSVCSKSYHNEPRLLAEWKPECQFCFPSRNPDVDRNDMCKICLKISKQIVCSSKKCNNVFQIKKSAKKRINYCIPCLQTAEQKHLTKLATHQSCLNEIWKDYIDRKSE